MRDLYVTLVYISIFVLGFTAPFVFTLGYLWVDVFYPQYISSSLDLIPVAQVMGIAAVGSYLLLDRKSPPRFNLHMLIVITYAVWVSLTTLWAVAPAAAEWKWDWAFKTIVFSLFLRFVLRSRVHIEAFLQVLLFAACANIIPFGLKTILSGGGYGADLGLIAGNTGFAESSYLSATAIALIPVTLYLRNRSILLPKIPLRFAMYTCIVLVCIAGALGTFARTALVGFAVVAVSLFLRSKRKIVFGFVLACLVGAAGYVTSEAWTSRIETITSYKQETSAATRLLVWAWTWDFVKSHPFGGGFEAWRTDRIVHPPGPDESEGVVEEARAFHSIYFEVLGEHGYVGEALYLALLITSLVYTRRVRRLCAGQPQLAWCSELAGALMTALLVLMACGAFIGIGAQAMMWYFMALPACLHEHVRRALKADTRRTADDLAAQAALGLDFPDAGRQTVRVAAHRL